MAYELVGNDVSAYVLTGNGQDGNPGYTNQYSLLGVWKDWELTFDLTRSNVKPSAQLLRQKRLTDLDWSINVSHLIASGGGWLGYAMFNGQFNMRMVFQEESGGGYFTAFGGISKGSIKRGEDAAMESFTLENLGPVGNTGSSLWYNMPAQFAAVTTLQQASNVIVAASVPTNFSTNFLTPTGIVAVQGGFQHP